MVDQLETIVACATPPGRGGVAIIRLSGESALGISLQLIKQKELQPRQAIFSHFIDNEDRLLDQGIIIFYTSPNSFTGEDVIELHTHGSPVVVDRIIKETIILGARIANPGEFSERAYLNGKIDLLQAEAVADLIDSSSIQAARSALRSLQGDFSKLIYVMRDQLVHLRTHIEGSLDFSDEELELMGNDNVSADLQKIIQTLEEVKKKATQGSRLREGAQLVICGKPNAGKSSLLNNLAGLEHAIVSEHEGTTRDLIQLEINLDGLPLHIVDTAGIRFTENTIEQEGIRRAKDAICKADMVLLVTDDREPLDEEDQEILSLIPKGAFAGVIRNKIDLSGNEVKITQASVNEIYLSAKTGKGLDELRRWIEECFDYAPFDESLFNARQRHIEALDNVMKFVVDAYELYKQTGEAELMAENLRLAQLSLAQITGEFTTDDLLGEIFSSFCIGK